MFMVVQKEKNMIHTSLKRVNLHCLKFIIFCSLFAITGGNLICIAEGKVYYVGGNGASDSYTQTQAQDMSTPWLTIKHACKNATAGDTILVRSGTYGAVYIDDGDLAPFSGDVNAEITYDADNYVIIKPDNGASVTIDAGSGSAITIGDTSGPYETFYRFENLNMIGGVSGQYSVGLYIYNCILTGTSSHHIGSRGVYTRNSSNMTVEGCKIDYFSYGFSGGESNWLKIIDCEITRHGQDVYNNLLVENNYIDNRANYRHISFYRCTNSIFRNNTVSGIYFRNKTGPPCSNIQVYNNLVFGNISLADVPSSAFSYYGHNIYVGSSLVGTNDYSYGSVSDLCANVFKDGIGYDPEITPNIGSGYPRDAAINTISYPSSVDDIRGLNRNIGSPDIGCYEYSYVPSDTTTPSVPQSLNAISMSEFQINLIWQESSDTESGIDHYNIYRDGNFIATSASTSYSDIELNSGTTYSYEVSAVNGAGLESNRSNVASATTLADTAPPSVHSVSASSATSVEILFSEALDLASAENIDNYSVSDGISITLVSLNLEHNRVTLSTTSHVESTTYILTVAEVKDTAGNSMPETSIEYEYNNGLIGLWHFDEGGGTTAGDSSGNGNTGTLVNEPIWTTGKITGALEFDGVDDYVAINHSPSFDVDNITVCAWVNHRDTGDDRVVCKSTSTAIADHIFSLGVYGTTVRVRLGNSSSNYDATTACPTNTWTHLAFTYDGSNVCIYVDGQLAGVHPYAGGPLAKLEWPVTIGNVNLTDNRYFNGIIDDVMIYNRALTADEIIDVFEADSLVFEPIGDKQVDEGSTLSFEVITQDPDQPVNIQDDAGLPFEPDEVFVNKIFSWTPGYGDAGSYDVTFVAPHDQLEDYETITITVNSVNTNQAPELETIGNKSVSEGETLSFLVSASDPDNDSITYSAQNLPSGATFSGSTFSWTPTSGQADSYQVTFVASDGQLEDYETITITVNSVNTNQAPELETIGNKSVSEGETLTFSVSANDPDNDSISYYAQNLPSGATFSGSTFSWTPTSGQADSYQVTFVASDGQLEDSETITITVNAEVPAEDPGWIELTYDDFENGFGNYTVGGKDCRLYTDGVYAHQGNNAANIQDNSGTASSFYHTSSIDVHTPGYTRIEVDFWFMAVSMDNTREDFWVQYYDGSTWQTVARSAYGTDFQNGQYYHEVVYVDEADYVFPTDMKIRFICDASGNRDDIYIDEIKVSAEEGVPDTTMPSPNPMTWAVAPFAAGSTSVSMVAATASDASGVEYYFECIAGDGHDSSWQDSPSYTDTGLSPETEYSYTVRVRDKSSNQNETAPSVAESATTPEAPVWTLLTYDDFEGGWGSYTRGGGDCKLYTEGVFAHQGSNAADIEDNSNASSSFYHTSGIDVHTPGYTRIEVDFWFMAVSMDSTKEDFWVQYYDGSTWQTVARYAWKNDFQNKQFYHMAVYIDEVNYTFPSDMKIRFMCDASGGGDDIYIDEVKVSAQ